jgi:hypothetical protein
VRYARPTSDLSNERIDFGAVLAVSCDGERIATLRPERSYFPSQQVAMGPVGRFFGGESTSEVGSQSNLRRDIWVAMQPDLRFLNGPIRRANRRFASSPDRVQAVVIAALTQLYVARAPAATFRVIVNPLVTWIWIGGLIVLCGALVALWPGGPSRRTVSSAHAARLGRELGGAETIAAYPLTSGNGAGARAIDPQLASLELRKQAKYADIRDAELDFRAGKLSKADHALLDAELRAEALVILDQIEDLQRGARVG